MFSKADLHMHSNMSDGSDTPGQLLNEVRRAGLDVFSLTDHDEYRGCAAIRELLADGDPAFINGIEFSCCDEQGKCHILGYGYNDIDSPVTRLADKTHADRKKRLEDRLEFLKGKGIEFSEEALSRLRAVNNCGKPHLAQEMISAGYVKDRVEAFGILNSRIEEDGYTTPEEAIDAILRSGGFPVLAHGILGDGRDKLTRPQISQRVKRLKAAGLKGLECCYSAYTDAQQTLMLELAAEYNLAVTAGSDYHGSCKTVRAGETRCTDPAALIPFFKSLKL